ncbi:endonuclease/exonuclease/phosphatase family protein [Umezawaea tangerina]|uniref:endonuclease/exonuclease/phosphatase family protein n=1 Tax=Umezawaea tangerina TaxID=84725 RepID=UPI001B806F7D|nr:endonuclease/exonuclease/phosphatase family protein [Umezawaea tangerina]
MADTEVVRRRRVGGGPLSAFLVLLTGVFLVAAGLRLLGIDGNRYMIAVTALTPYTAAAGVLLGCVALLLRRWAAGMVVLLVAVVLVAAVAPRAFPDSRPNGVGTEVRVMSVNLLLGEADAVGVVAAVRSNQVDVLALQELTQEAVLALDRAGLREVLPNRLFQPEVEGYGSGIASRYGLTAKTLTPPSGMRQVGALVDLPGSQDIEVLSVHSTPPVVPSGPEAWQRELAGLPNRDVNGPPRVLAGDFNATLDHVGLRRLLANGYVDAGDEVGAGLEPTWPSGRFWPPPVTLDHVLVDNRCPVDTYGVITIGGTDHRAVVTQFVVPAR